MANEFSNPVPLGKAGTGSAVVFGSGLGALHDLIKNDALVAKSKERAQALKERAQAAAARQTAQEQKNLLSKVKFNTDGGLHYLPMMNAKRGQVYKELEALYTDPTKSLTEKYMGAQQKMDDWNAEIAASKANDDYLTKELQSHRQDKRINTDAAGKLLTDSLYQREADGSPAVDEQGNRKLVPALEWDPKAATDALTKGNGHLVGDEIYSQFLDTIPENSVTYSREALPGGRGFRNEASSDIFELEHGKIKRDPKTTRPVLRDSHETLAAFQSDPLNRQWLDGQLQQHQQVVRQATDKLQRREALTPIEQEALQIEQAPAGPRMELFKKDLLRYGYQREESTLLQKPAHVPPAAAAANTVTVPTEALPGAVLGGTGVNGTSGLISYGVMGGVTYGKPGQEVKKFSAHGVKHQELITQRDDGSPAEVNTANQTKMDLEYGARHIFLRGKNGTVFFPPKVAVEAAKRGDFGPSEDFARQTRASHPDARPEWYVEATPLGKNQAQPGAKLKYFTQLKAAQEANGNPKNRLSDQQLHAQVDREFGQQNATHYVRYYGTDKKAIDQATGYKLRTNARVQQAMTDALAEAERRTRPRADTPRPTTSAGSFYTPKAAKPVKVTPTSGPQPPLLSAPKRDPYAL